MRLRPGVITEGVRVEEKAEQIKRLSPRTIPEVEIRKKNQLRRPIRMRVYGE